MYESFFISFIGFFGSILVGMLWSNKDPYGFDQASKGHKGFLSFLFLTLTALSSIVVLVGSFFLILGSAF